MRLLTVGSLPPEWGGPLRGGAATFHAALLTGLLERHPEVEVVGVLPPAPLDRELSLPVFARPEGTGRAAFYEEILGQLRPDVVLMNHIAHTVGVTHARLGSPVPAVGVVHSWHSVTWRSGEERRRAIELSREALTGLSAMVAPSRNAMEEGEGLGFRYPRIAETIHNPVPPLYMADDIDAVASARRDVVFLGSLIPRKEPAALVRAAALLPDAHFVLAGQGELEADLRALIDELGLNDRVRLAGLPAGDDHLPRLRELLLASQAMCLPSRSEGLPLAFLEALACGTPVVGFGPAVREIRDELGIEVGEPIDDSAPEEIAAAIEKVSTTRWDRRRLRRATLARFGLDRVADRYVNLLSRVVARRDAGRDARSNDSAEDLSRPAPASAAARAGEAVCVLGPSRSGTSLTARILDLAGVYLGPADELLGSDLRQLAGEGEAVLERAGLSNPGGHWEHYRLMRLNERILRRLGGNWRDPPPLPPGWEVSEDLVAERLEARVLLAESFAGHDLWAWKDPRNSLTLPFWRQLLPRMRYVICVRNPVDVAASLQRRDGIPLEHGVELWLTYLAAALVNTAGRPRLIVSYEAYFADAEAAVGRLASFVGRAEAVGDSASARRLAEAVDERLWRNRASPPKVATHEGASPAAASLYRVVSLLVRAQAGSEGSRDRVAALGAAADLYAEGLLRRSAERAGAPSR